MKKICLLLCSLFVVLGVLSNNGIDTEAFSYEYLFTDDFEWYDDGVSFNSYTIMNNDGYIYAISYADPSVLNAHTYPTLYDYDKKTPITQMDSYATEITEWGGFSHIYRLKIINHKDIYQDSVFYSKVNRIKERWRSSDGFSTAWLTEITPDYAPPVNPWNTGHGGGAYVPPEEFTPIPGALYRFSRPDGKDWLLTNNLEEIGNLIDAYWKNDGIVGFVGNGAPVYRFYNPTTNDRMYSNNDEEMRNYTDAGWKNEGPAFNQGNSLDVIRYYNTEEIHIWSVNKEEQDNFDAAGWKREGLAFRLNAQPQN